MNWLKLQKIQLWTEVDNFWYRVFRARRFSVQSPAKAQDPGRARFFVVHAKKSPAAPDFQKNKMTNFAGVEKVNKKLRNLSFEMTRISQKFSIIGKYDT